MTLLAGVLSWLNSDESWDCESCRENNLCETRNCEGITNPNFLTVLQVDDKRWEPVNVCPITLLPDDYRFNAVYLMLARKFRFTPNEVDAMPMSTVNFFLASCQAESWVMQWEKKKLESAAAMRKQRKR